jgi:hypothetical protein
VGVRARVSQNAGRFGDGRKALPNFVNAHRGSTISRDAPIQGRHCFSMCLNRSTQSLTFANDQLSDARCARSISCSMHRLGTD